MAPNHPPASPSVTLISVKCILWKNFHQLRDTHMDMHLDLWKSMIVPVYGLNIFSEDSETFKKKKRGVRVGKGAHILQTGSSTRMLLNLERLVLKGSNSFHPPPQTTTTNKQP